MLSYLSNRHYHILSKQFPQDLRIDQPKVVYFPTHNVEKVEVEEVIPYKKSKLRVKKSKCLPTNENLFEECCPICLSSDNIVVEYYGKNHVCVKCRKLIRDQFGNQIRIFVNENGQIVCLGIKKTEKIEEQDEGSRVYYYTDYTNLQINGRSGFATFANPDEMVIILRMIKHK